MADLLDGVLPFVEAGGLALVFPPGLVRLVLGLQLAVDHPSVARLLFLQSSDEAVQFHLAGVQFAFGAPDESLFNPVELGHLEGEGAAGLAEVELVGGG